MARNPQIRWPDGIWRGTWTPSDSTGSQVNLRLAVNSVAASTQSVIFGAVEPGGPRPEIKGLVNADGSQLLGDAVVPGQIITIFGTRLSDQIVDAGSTPAGPLGGTTVRLGSTTLPLFYVSPTQINALIPLEIAVDRVFALTVESDGAVSTPLTVVTVP